MITPDILLAGCLAKIDALNLPCRDGTQIEREVYSARHQYQNRGLRFTRRGIGIISSIKSLQARKLARLDKSPQRIWLTDDGEQAARAAVGLPGLRLALLLGKQLSTAWRNEDSLLAIPDDEARYRLEFELLPLIVRGLIATQCEGSKVAYRRVSANKVELPADRTERRSESASAHYQRKLLRLLDIRSTGLSADELLAL